MYQPHTYTAGSVAVSRYLDRSPEETIKIEFGMKLRDVEKLLILETLKQQRYNRTRAARVLGIGIRTLQRKIKQYQASEPAIKTALEG